MNGILLMHIDFITLLCLMIFDTLNNWDLLLCNGRRKLLVLSQKLLSLV